MQIKRAKKSPINSLAGGAGTYLAAGLISKAIPFLLLPVLTRFLEPAEYGEIAVFLVWVSLVGALCGLSVHGAAARKYYDYNEPDKEIGDFITACLTVLVGSSVVLLFLLMPFTGWLSAKIGLSETWLYIGVLFAFCNFLVQLRLGQWQVRKNPKSFGSFQISKSLADMLLSIVLVVGFALGVTGRLAGQSIVTVSFGLLALFLLWREGFLTMTWRPKLIREALNFGVPLIPHVVGMFLLITIDRAIISTQIGLEAAGHYMVAAQLSMVMGLMLDSVNKAYVPWLFERLKRNDTEEKKFIVRLTYCYGVFLFMCAALAFLIGGEVLVFIAGEQYRPAAKLIGWFVLAKAFQGMYYTVTNYIFYSKRTGILSKITISCGLLNVLLLFFLINEFGLIGAAWSMCISMFLQWVIAWRFAAMLIKMPWFFWRTSPDK